MPLLDYRPEPIRGKLDLVKELVKESRVMRGVRVIERSLFYMLLIATRCVARLCAHSVSGTASTAQTPGCDYVFPLKFGVLGTLPRPRAAHWRAQAATAAGGASRLAGRFAKISALATAASVLQACMPQVPVTELAALVPSGREGARAPYAARRNGHR